MCIRDSVITFNEREGVILSSSHNNVIRGGEIGENNNGEFVYSDSVGVMAISEEVLLNRADKAVVEAESGIIEPFSSSYGNGGVFLTGSDNNLITGIYMHDNKYAALNLYMSSSNIIDGNNIDENCGGEAGIYLYSSDGTVIRNNYITRGTGYGIMSYYSCCLEILDNYIADNSYYGNYLYYSSAELINSDFISNAGYGIYSQGSYSAGIGAAEIAGVSSSERALEWRIKEDVLCEDNDVYIQNGAIIPLGGTLTASSCQVWVNGHEFGLEGSKGQQGFIQFYIEELYPCDTETGRIYGGPDYAIEFEFFDYLIPKEVKTETYSYNTLTVHFFNKNPVSSSNYRKEAFGKWVKTERDGYLFASGEPSSAGAYIMKIFYADNELADSKLKENSLFIQFFDEKTGKWVSYGSSKGGVNTEENYVWAEVEEGKYGVFGIFGDKVSSSPAGGARGGFFECYTTWECTEWSECIDGFETRECVKENTRCINTTEKPEEARPCDGQTEVEEQQRPLLPTPEEPGQAPTEPARVDEGVVEPEEETAPEEEEEDLGVITGRIADEQSERKPLSLTGGGWPFLLLLLILILIALGIVYLRHKNRYA